MNITLFHPRGYTLDPRHRKINAVACVMPPIGVLSIAAVLRKAGHRVRVLDAALDDRTSNEQWARIIVSKDPDIVGFSATTAAFIDAYDVCCQVKQLRPSIVTVFGGVHASWGKEILMRDFPAIDHIIAGEGEQAMLQLAAGVSAAAIPNTFFRDGASVQHGPDAVSECVLDDLPFPAYDLLEGFPRRYLMPLFGYPHHPGANIVSSRGCVYQCPYCDRSVFGRSFRWNSPEYTVEQIRWLQGDFGVRHVNFYDDLFTLNRERVERLCTLLCRIPRRTSFNCIVRIGHIDRELIRMLKKAGCWMVSVGIESGDERILEANKDGVTLEAIRRDIGVLHSEGLWVKGLFMMGFPGETLESIVKTRELALSLPLKDANLTAYTPFPGAPIARNIADSGEFRNDWVDMDCVNFVFVPSEIGDRAVLERHYREFFKRFYQRPFMRRHVYPAMLLQSPHSFVRLLRSGPDFLRYARSLKHAGTEGGEQ